MNTEKINALSARKLLERKRLPEEIEKRLTKKRAESANRATTIPEATRSGVKC